MTPPPLWLAILQAARVDRNLRGVELRVLLYCAEMLDAAEPRVLRGWHAAGALALDPAQVTRAVQRLCEAGYLAPHVPTGGYTLAVPTAPARSRPRVDADVNAVAPAA